MPGQPVAFLQWVWGLLGDAAIAAALLGLAMWLFKAQIAQWLNRDLERLKAQYARELEAYKVTLIAETERTKAKQELQKAGALRIIEKKYQALHGLQRATDRIGATAWAAVHLPPGETRTRLVGELGSKIDSFSAAASEIGPFLAPDEWAKIMAFQNVLIVANGRGLANSVLDDAAFQLETQIASAEIEIDDLIRNLLTQMMTI